MVSENGFRGESSMQEYYTDYKTFMLNKLQFDTFWI